MSDFSAQIEREELAHDSLTPAKARRWLATFDLKPIHGKAMPQGIHWCLCLPDAASGDLGEDGHPRRDLSDSFLPPIPLARRMWAGSECRFLAPVELGSTIERRTSIKSITEKEGRSGRLAFVTLGHEFRSAGNLAVHEQQTLVYRDAPTADAEPAPPPYAGAPFDPGNWDRTEIVTPDMPLLFRYSALTFNTHRIHYDADYVRDVERYRGPVVHGPLMASLLLQLAARQLGSENALTGFSFRGLSPAIVSEPLFLSLRMEGAGKMEMAIHAKDGRPVMQAAASYPA